MAFNFVLGLNAAQCLKCRIPVNTIAMPYSSAADTTSSSFFLVRARREAGGAGHPSGKALAFDMRNETR